MTAIPDSPDALLSEKSTSAALKEAGYQVEQSSLATYRCRGGGPPFRKFGQRVIYRWGDSLDWAKARTSGPVSSSSELKVA